MPPEGPNNEELMFRMNQALDKLVQVAELQAQITGDKLKAQKGTTKSVDEVANAVTAAGEQEKALMSPLIKIPLLYSVTKSISSTLRDSFQRSDKLQREALGRGSNLTKMMKHNSAALFKLSGNLTGYQNALDTNFEAWAAGLRSNSEAMLKLGVYTRITTGGQKALFTSLAKTTAGLGLTSEQLDSLANTLTASAVVILFLRFAITSPF